MKKSRLFIFGILLMVFILSASLVACEEESTEDSETKSVFSQLITGTDKDADGNQISADTDNKNPDQSSKDAHGHEIVEEEVIVRKPSCSEEGLKNVCCVTCGEVIRSEKIPATEEHLYEEYVTAPTKTQNGKVGQKCSTCGNEQIESEYDLSFTLIDNTYYEVTRGLAELAKVVIPSSFDGKPVTSIGSSAFSNCNSLTKITIPDSISHIGSGAYTNTKCIDSSNGVTYVDKWVVGCDTSITQVNLRDNTVGIADFAFSGCSSLTNITIPSSVTSIGDYAFYQSYSLTSITFAEGSQLTSIGEGAFYYCRSLTSISIPEGVTSIGDGAFSDCSSLTSITVEEGNSVYHSSGNCLIETASKTLLTGCKNSVISSDGSVTSIGESAFYNCSSLTSITIPAGVTSIGDHAFEYCHRLVEVCNLSKLEITKGSEDNGYVGCYAKDIYYSTDYESKISTDSDGYVVYTDGEEKSLVNYVGDATVLTLPTDILIGAYAFYECSSLTSITIPSGATCIGNYAFRGCSSLTSITFAEGSLLTSIGEGAFDDCRSLTSITIPAGVTSIGVGAFEYCSSLTSIIIPSGVTSIGAGAFFRCDRLSSLTFEDASNWYKITCSVFEVTNAKENWKNKTGGTEVAANDLSNASTNASNFTGLSYMTCYWYKLDT